MVEERAASKLCAWPACDQPLQPASLDKTGRVLPPKKYHLSLRHQRVYDVTAAAQFCGEECFMQSEMFKTGLSDEPFYLRQIAKKQQQQQALQAQPTQPTLPTQGQSPQAAGSAATSEQKSKEDEDAAPLLIVEKEASVSHSFPTPGIDASNPVRALAVEGYAPKHAVMQLDGKTKDAQAKGNTSVKHFAVQPPSEPLSESPPAPIAAKEEPAPAQPSTAEAASPISTPLPSSDSQPVAALASTAAPASNEAANSAPADPAPSPAASTPPASSSTSARPPVPSAATPEFLPFTSLPAVAENAPLRSLTRAEFNALPSEEQLDYLARVALFEKQKVQQQPGFAGNAPTPAASLPPVAEAADAEPKIRRRKTAAQKATASNSDNAAPVSSADDAAKSSTPASPRVARSSPSSSTAASPPSSSSSSDADAAAAAAAKRALIDQYPCDYSDPIITPAEIKNNISAVRNLQPSPFMALLQVVMRWTTTHTGDFVRTGRLPVPQPAAGNRQRQSAFLAMVQQHLTQLAARLHIHRSFVRELRELSDTFCFDEPIPPLKAELWRIITLLLLKAVSHRVALHECSVPASTPASSWLFLAPFSSDSTSLQSTLEGIVHASGFGMDQLDSAYQQWIMQSMQSYV